MGIATASAAGSVTTVAGYAYGYRAYGITIFGGAQPDNGPTPTAELATNASNSPQSGASSSGSVQYGPAVLFTSDGIAVTTSGSLGTNGSVTSGSTILNVNHGGNDGEPLTASGIASMCSATTSGASGSTSVSGGTVVTNNGATPPTVVNVPTSPAPNTAISGKIVISPTDSEKFKFVFNEQIKSGRSIIVNAVHEYMQGPTFKGNLIVGQVVCSTAGTDGSVQSPGITHTPSPVPHGTTVTFTVTVSNLGPNSAPAVADASSVTGGKITKATPSAGSCSTPTLQGAAVSCKLGTIASGHSVTVHVAVLAPATSGGSIAISSTVVCPADDNPSNNTSTDSVSVS